MLEFLCFAVVLVAICFPLGLALAWLMDQDFSPDDYDDDERF